MVINAVKAAFFVLNSGMDIKQAQEYLKETADVSREVRKLIYELLGLTTTTNGQTKANLGLTTSFKMMAAGIKNVAIEWAKTPMGIGTIAVASIYALVKVVNYFNESIDRSRENLDNLKNEYNNNESELKSLENELQTTSERMKELEAIESPTMAEQEELDLLIAQNAELERSVHLLEAEQKLLAKEKAEAFVDVAEQSMGRTYTPDSDYNQYDNLNAKIEAYKQLQDELTRLEQEKAILYWQTARRLRRNKT